MTDSHMKCLVCVDITVCILACRDDDVLYISEGDSFEGTFETVVKDSYHFLR